MPLDFINDDIHANRNHSFSTRKNIINSTVLPFQSANSQPVATREYFVKEFVNSMIHGLGILFGLAAVPLLIAMAVRTNNPLAIAGTGVYGFSFLMLFTFSTSYHGCQHTGLKKILEVLDHISIYFLIAGTYTPLILSYLNNTMGMVMLAVLWGLTIVGSFFKVFFGCRFNIVSTIVYVLMGWMLVWTGGDFFNAMPPVVITMIVTGGLLYSIGVVFYLWEKLKWNHAIWHSFVLSAAVCHYVAVLITVSP
jgi:hemolysin III